MFYTCHSVLICGLDQNKILLVVTHRDFSIEYQIQIEQFKYQDNQKLKRLVGKVRSLSHFRVPVCLLLVQNIYTIRNALQRVTPVAILHGW